MLRGFFWIGGTRVARASGTYAAGAMYVEWERPRVARPKLPVVLVHGGGGQGTDWLGTPDGRPGWAPYLLEAGFPVYVIDRPGHGRSPLDPELLGPLSPSLSYEAVERMFAGGKQWPDGALDPFMAAQGPRRADLAAAHALEQRCGVDLLERIGPALLITHSAGGPLGFLMADARPDLVVALVALEPFGPPFRDELPWGLTAAPVSYEPPPPHPSELARMTRSQLRLINLARVRIALVSGERSPFAGTTAEIQRFLRHCGCEAEHLALAEYGVHGNGHGMMLESNHRDVLAVVLDWLARRTAIGPATPVRAGASSSPGRSRPSR